MLAHQPGGLSSLYMDMYTRLLIEPVVFGFPTSFGVGKLDLEPPQEGRDKLVHLSNRYLYDSESELLIKLGGGVGKAQVDNSHSCQYKSSNHLRSEAYVGPSRRRRP